MIKASRTISLFGAFVLVGCGIDRTSMAPVEGGNPGLEIQVASIDGNPAVGASVVAWSRADTVAHPDSFVVLATGRTDPSGKVVLDLDTNRTWALQARSGDSTIGVLRSLPWDRSARLVLGKPAQVHGAFQGVWHPRAIGVRDLPLRTTVESDGQFTLGGLPSGIHELVEIGGGHRAWRQIRVEAGQMLDLGSVRMPLDSVLVDDFEGPGRYSLLEGKVASGIWRVQLPSGDPLRMEPGSETDAAFEETRMLGDNGSGKSWKIRVQNFPSDTLRRGTVFLDLDPRGVDARGLVGLAFLARGSLRIRVGLVGATEGRLWKNLIIRSGGIWGPIDLPIESFEHAPSVEPEKVLGELARIEWTVLDTMNVELWLDDLRMRGWKP